MTKRLALVGAMTIAGFCASAQTQLDGRKVNTISTAVPFLRISPDARSGGMGDVGIALSPDANAQYWNLAKMPFNDKIGGVSATYTPWLKDLVPDIFLAYLSGYYRFGQDTAQALSASLRYFSLGDIQYTDLDANSLGTGMPREFSFDVGYSRRLSRYLSAGLGLRYIHSNIASGVSGNQASDYKPANAFAADLGVFYTNTKELDEYRFNNFSFGAIVSNIGSRVTYSNQRKDFLPANLGIGASYTAKVDEYNKLTFALDLNKLLVPTPTDTSTQPGVVAYDPHREKSVVSSIFSSFGDAPFSEELREIAISVGAEYWYQDQFAVRAGYFYEDKTKGDRKYLTVGLGVRYSKLTINASYLVPSGTGTTRNPLSNTLRFTLMADFDALKKVD